MDTVVYNRINPPITTRFIRLQPVQWNNVIAIRMEVYGCPGMLGLFLVQLYIIIHIFVEFFVCVDRFLARR